MLNYFHIFFLKQVCHCLELNISLNSLKANIIKYKIIKYKKISKHVFLRKNSFFPLLVHIIFGTNGYIFFSPILIVVIRVSFRSTNNDISVMHIYNILTKNVYLTLICIIYIYICTFDLIYSLGESITLTFPIHDVTTFIL